MRKKITFTYENEKYTLEFDAYSLKKMEERGFDFNRGTENIPITLINDIFKGAFIKHHDNLSSEKIDEIYGALTNATKDGTTLNDAIAEMFSQAISSITYNEGNVEWSLES